MKILILYASYGNGHQKAAESLHEYYSKNHPEYEIKLMDAMKYSSPEIDKLFMNSYKQLTQKMPSAWGKIYHLTDHYQYILDTHSHITELSAIRFRKIVVDFEPDYIICTHPFPVDMLAYLKRKNRLRAKLGMVITDYALHYYWLTNWQIVDEFFVAQPYLINELELAGVDKAKIHSFGIPVSQKFSKQYTYEDLPADIVLEKNVFTILYMATPETRLSKNIDLLKDLLRLHNVQIVIVTGRNTKLKKAFEKFIKHSTKNIILLGFTDKIPELMKVSDLIISKPGGLTTTEAIVSNVPFVVVSPIPGQEEQNSNYILNNGLGFRLFNNSNKLFTLYEIIENTQRLKQVKEMQKLLAKPDAAKNICEKMLEKKNDN